MAVYTKLIPIVLKWEGGYAGNIDGMTCTMKGVTLATYRKFFGKNKNCKDLKAITNAEWDLIFKEGFWDKWKADDIESQAIANLLVDWCWASGVYGIKLPQRVLGVKDDGIVGKKTIAAINDYPDKKELFQKLWNRRKKHFQDIAKNGKEKFLKGWLNRLNDFKYFE
jgi:lysozyme family protein